MLTTIPYNTIALDLQSALNSAQTSLTALLNTYQSGDNASIPFLGSSLGNAAQFAPQIVAALNTLSSTDPSTSVQNAFVHTLGPLLVNDNDTQGNAADVHSTIPASDGSFQAFMRVHVAINPVTTDFKSGLPALPLQLAGAALDFTVNSYVDYELSFNYTAGGSAPHTTLSGGHPLAGGPGNNHELLLISTAQLPSSFSGTATLGFIKGTIGIATNKTSSLSVTATADQFENAQVVRGPLTFSADAYLQLTGGIDGVPAAAAFPTISTTIHLQWDNSTGGGPHISFEGVSLNLGQFIRNVLGPVLGSIQSITAPIKPAIDALTKSLPVLSDISNAIGGGDISLMSITAIASSYAGLGPLAGLFSSIATFISDLGNFDPNFGSINLGDFTLDGFNVQNSPTAGDPLDLAHQYLTSFDTSHLAGNQNAYSSVVNALPDGNVKTSLQKLVSSLSGNPNSIDLEFPILDSPGKAIFNVLMGRDSDLFTLKGNLSVDAQESTGADLLGMGLSFNGAVHLAGQLTFAYDTYGLRELIRDGASSTGSDLLDGFYLKTDSNLQIGGSIGISAEVSVGIAGANVTGSVGTPNGQAIAVTINTSKDTDHDGKLRFKEFPSNPLDAFNVAGEIDAALTFEIQIGVKTLFGFLGYSKDFDIARTVVFSFNPPAPPPPATLASPANGQGSPQDGSGVVLLYAGKEAIRRVGVDDHDGGPDGTGENYVIKHIGDDSTGETIEIDAFGESQTITGVKTIWANGDVGDLMVNVMPGVEADVVINNAPDPLDSNYTGPYTNQGHAYLTYSGTGTARLTAGHLASALSGGRGTCFLYGGAANDTFVTGQGTNFITDDAGDNLIYDLPRTGYISLDSSSNAYNTLKIVAGSGTTSISETPDGGYLLSQIQYSDGGSTADHLPFISQLIIDTQANAAAINIGAVSMDSIAAYLAVGGSEGRSVTVDGPTPIIGNPNVLIVEGVSDPHTNVKGVDIAEDTISSGNVSVLGLAASDTLTIKVHGGATNIGDLGFSGPTVILDDSIEQRGFDEAYTLTTPVETLGSTITTGGYGPFGSGGFLVQAQGDPDIVFKGLAATDSLTMKISAAPLGKANQVNVDAFPLTGALHLNAAGPVLAINNILVSAVSEHATLSIDSSGTSTTATFGTGHLEPIEGHVSVTGATLILNNSADTVSNILTLTGDTVAGWDISPLVAPPSMTFSNLDYFTVNAGAADQFDLENTPNGVIRVNLENNASARDFVYVAGASAQLALDGDFKLYLGERLAPDETVSRINSLQSLSNVNVTFNYSSLNYVGFNPTLVDFVDPGSPVQSYTVSGNGNLVVTDQSIGLVVTINDYRSQDGVLIDLPGGGVNADLTTTGPGTITVDGSARLLGLNVGAPLNLTVHARAGAVFMEPIGNNGVVLPMFNKMYLAGSRPQDSLDVYDSNNKIAVANDAIPASYAQFTAASGNPTIVTAGQPFDFTVIAQDHSGATLTNYTNQVQWYGYNQATGDYFSSNYESFTPADQGQHTFNGLLLPAVGTYTLGFDDGWNASSFTINAMAGPVAPEGQTAEGNASPTSGVASSEAASLASAGGATASGSAASCDSVVDEIEAPVAGAANNSPTLPLAPVEPRIGIREPAFEAGLPAGRITIEPPIAQAVSLGSVYADWRQRPGAIETFPDGAPALRESARRMPTLQENWAITVVDPLGSEWNTTRRTDTTNQALSTDAIDNYFAQLDADAPSHVSTGIDANDPLWRAANFPDA